MTSVTSEEIIAAGPDDSSDTDFFNSSLSIWRGPKSSLEDSEKPVPLDLHTASSIGSYDMVRMYINSEADLNAKNVGGYTALMYAAYIGHDNIVNLLIEAQANVNLANDKGLTPLMLAASCGNESVCYFLKDAGADLESKDRKGWTALFHATYNGHQNCVKFLLESGAKIDAVEPKYGLTPLMQAAFHGHEIIVQCLLQQRANRHLTSRTGETAESLALKRGHMKIVTLLQSSAKSASRGSHNRPGSPYRSSSNDSSDDGDVGSVQASRLSKHYNIHEGPKAMSKMMSPSSTPSKANVTFKESPAGKKPSRGKQPREFVSPITQAEVAAPKVVPVAPTPKPVSNRPKDVHELLESLNLLKYEEIFIKQDIDLEVFYTLSSDDLKEIGITTFGPRRKMTNAIENYHKEAAASGTSLTAVGNDSNQLSTLVEQLKYELQEKSWQLTQAYTQLAGYHSSIEHYHKDLEHEKNIRSLTESYLLAEKNKLSDIVKQCQESRAQCSKALRGQGKVKNLCQLLRARHEESLEIGSLPQQLQESLHVTDEATKTQISAMTALKTSELWEGLQQGLRDASTATAMVILNLDKLVKSASEDH